MYFLIGLTYGFGPCLSLCVPTVLGLVVANKQNATQGTLASATFSLGRLVAYLTLGGIAALLGSMIRIDVISLARLNFSVFALNLAIGIYLIATSAIHNQSRKEAFFLHRKFGRFSFLKGKAMFFAFGLVVGFIPCAPLLGILADVFATSNPIFSVGKVALFGLGTSIGTVALGLVGGKIVELCKRRNILSKLSGFTGALIIGLALLRL